MIFNIDDTIIKKTTRCKKNFSCLSDKRKELCRVIRNVEDKVHFVECLDIKSCSYRLPFGDAFFCTCPVRKVIYTKYKI
jgi:hypothetical protein